MLKNSPLKLKNNSMPLLLNLVKGIIFDNVREIFLNTSREACLNSLFPNKISAETLAWEK